MTLEDLPVHVANAVSVGMSFEGPALHGGGRWAVWPYGASGWRFADGHVFAFDGVRPRWGRSVR